MRRRQRQKVIEKLEIQGVCVEREREGKERERVGKSKLGAKMAEKVYS
jgi:hypothetical protein